MARILLTNDDGFEAVQLWELAHALEKGNGLCIVAPHARRSWGGKAITRAGNVKCREKNVDGLEMLVCDGTPADCTLIGLGHYFPNPDLVVAGLNNGANFSHYSAFGSGTVGAALEAALHGVFGVAISSHVDNGTFHAVEQGTMGVGEQRKLFGPAALAAAKIISLLDREKVGKLMSAGVGLLNINLPQVVSESSGWEVASLASVEYGRLFHKTGEGEFQHSGFEYPIGAGGEGTDVCAVARGKISITPMTLRTDYRDLGKVAGILGCK